MNDLKGIIEDCNKSDLVSKEAIKKIIEIIGQEEWNYLYDENSNICTTMGELIITLKGIPELEKEIAELKTKKIPQLERKIASIRGCHSVDAKKLNARIEQVERLKKENAELLCQKNRNKSCYSCANATERCFRNEIGCPCQKYKSWKEGDMHALDYTLIHFGNNDDLKTEVEALKKCLRGIVYMAESGLHTKNELAFARCIAEAKELCKE